MDQKENCKNPSSIQKPLTIGAFLKEEREKQEIPIKIISRTTKISTTLLEYLEKDALDQLPNKAYVTGFIKSYCKSLGINESESLNLLDQTYLSLFPNRKNDGLNKNFSPNPSPQKSSKSMAVFLILAVGSLTTYFLNGEKVTQKDNSFEKISHQSLNIKTPLHETQDEVKLAQDSIRKKELPPSPIPEATKKVKENDKKDEEKVKKKFNFLPIKGPLFAYKVNPSVEELKFLPKNIKEEAGPQKVYIKAHNGESWITFKTDKNPIKQLFLRKDKSLFIKGKEIRLFLGNINATKIFINDRPITYSSRTGVKSLVIPERNNEKYHLPLFVFEKSGRARTSEEIIKKLN